VKAKKTKILINVNKSYPTDNMDNKNVICVATN